VGEMQREKIEGRRVYLDLLEATMVKKNLNRDKKQERKLKV